MKSEIQFMGNWGHQFYDHEVVHSNLMMCIIEPVTLLACKILKERIDF